MRFTIVLIAAAVPLTADCIDGVRQPSAAEKQYLEQIYKRLVAALPAAPAGWEMTPPPADLDRGQWRSRKRPRIRPCHRGQRNVG